MTLGDNNNNNSNNNKNRNSGLNFKKNKNKFSSFGIGKSFNNLTNSFNTSIESIDLLEPLRDFKKNTNTDSSNNNNSRLSTKGARIPSVTSTNITTTNIKNNQINDKINQNINVDFSSFAVSQFNEDKYVDDILSKYSDNELKTYFISLKGARNAVTLDLQSIIYKNHSKFGYISREVSTLESDLLILRSQLSKMSEIADSIIQPNKSNLSISNNNINNSIDSLDSNNDKDNEIDNNDNNINIVNNNEDDEDITSSIESLTNTSNNISVKDNLTDDDIERLTDILDTLDVYIAQREFDIAVDEVQNSRKLLAQAGNESKRVILLRNSIEERALRLSQLVSLELSNPLLTKKQVQINIERLLKFGLGEQARDYFLSSRSEVIRHRIRSLKFEGDIIDYINDLSSIVFKLIKNTCEWYAFSFNDAIMTSGFVKWVLGEMEKYAVIFKRHVFITDDSLQDFSIIAQCFTTAMEYCDELRSVGFELSFLLDMYFHNNICDSIINLSNICIEDIKESINKKQFKLIGYENIDDFPADVWESEFGNIKLSESVFIFYKILIQFAGSISELMNMPLYSQIVECLISIFYSYFDTNEFILSSNKDSIKLNDKKIILDNIKFVIDSLLPSVTSQLSSRFERSIPELEDLLIDLQSKYSILNTKTLN